MIIVCNIWMICLELNWFFSDPSWMLQLSEFVWTLRSSVWIVFNNFLLIDATDSCKIRSDQKRLFFAVSLYPLSFFANTPFNICFSPYHRIQAYIALTSTLLSQIDIPSSPSPFSTPPPPSQGSSLGCQQCIYI